MKILNRWKAWSRKKKILGGVVLAALVLITVAGLRTYARRKAQAAIRESFSQVETVQVTKQNLIDSISVTGTIASADSRDVQAIAKNVEVLEVNYEVGDYVNEGDVIVVLDSTDLEISLAQAQNSQALSQYNESKNIESASESYEQAVEDSNTKYNRAAKTLAEAQQELQDALSDYEDAEEEKDDADDDRDEAKDVMGAKEAAYQAAAAAYNKAKDGVGSADSDKAAGGGDGSQESGGDASVDLTALEQAMASAKAAWESAASAYNAAESNYSGKKQAYNTAKDAYEKALDTYEKASESLQDTETDNNRSISNAADSLEKSQAAQKYSNDSSTQSIENFQDQIDSCTVKAPRSGVITAMNVEVGDTYMGEGNTLFTVADEKNFVVSASVDEYDISSIVKDQAAAVIVEALGDEELPATVSFVSPTAAKAEYGSSTYSIEIALEDENTDLRIGMTAKASIVLDAVYDVLTVPYDCVATDEDGNSTLAIDQDGERVEIPVVLGMQGDYYVEVSGEGLDETTLVYYSTAMAKNAASGGDNGESGMMFNMGGGMPSGGGTAPGNRGGGMPGGPGGF